MRAAASRPRGALAVSQFEVLDLPESSSFRCTGAPPTYAGALLAVSHAIRSRSCYPATRWQQQSTSSGDPRRTLGERDASRTPDAVVGAPRFCKNRYSGLLGRINNAPYTPVIRVSVLGKPAVSVSPLSALAPRRSALRSRYTPKVRRRTRQRERKGRDYCTGSGGRGAPPEGARERERETHRQCEIPSAGEPSRKGRFSRFCVMRV